MRIISVVTLISPDGAYGGPTRVALNQAAALRSRGHSVVLAAGARGFESLPSRIDGEPVRLFPARTVLPSTGYAGLASPSLLRWLLPAARQADVVHIHAARDLITLPAAAIARRAGTPYVLQTHGMIDESPRRSARVLDAIATRRILRGASAVFFLTPREQADLRSINQAGDLPLVELLNGVPRVSEPPPWPPAPAEVLFLARLHPRKRPELFVRMAAALAGDYPDVRFNLVGPDEGEGARVEALLSESACATWEGPLAPDETLARMGRCSIYVLPSVDEPFPMSVLEAMSLARPVVITKSCGLAPLVRQTGAGLVVGESLEELTEAVASLLADPEEARSRGAAGLAASRERLGMSAIAERLESEYELARAS